jgi:hypothetical protein
MSLKQAVNLLKIELPTKDKFFHTIKFFYASNIVLIIGLFLACIFFIYQQKSILSHLAQEESRLKALEAILKEKEELKFSLAPPEYLTKNYNRQNKKKFEQIELKRFLTMRDEPTCFSDYLSELNAITTEGMQLDKILIQDFGEEIFFKGASFSPQILSDWIAKLKMQSHYEKVIFDAVTLERDKESPYFLFEFGSVYVA